MKDLSNSADTRPLTFIELKKLRIAHDQSNAEEMAKALGISLSALRKLEKGVKLLFDMNTFYKKMEDIYDADIERLKFCIEYDFGSKCFANQEFRFIQYTGTEQNIRDVMRFLELTRKEISEQITFIERGDCFTYDDFIFGENVKESDYLIKRDGSLFVVNNSVFGALFR